METGGFRDNAPGCEAHDQEGETCQTDRPTTENMECKESEKGDAQERQREGPQHEKPEEEDVRKRRLLIERSQRNPNNQHEHREPVKEPELVVGTVLAECPVQTQRIEDRENRKERPVLESLRKGRQERDERPRKADHNTQQQQVRRLSTMFQGHRIGDFPLSAAECQ
jgi:hypothetical protein